MRKDCKKALAIYARRAIIEKTQGKCAAEQLNRNLQGRVRFPTGGIVRERLQKRRTGLIPVPTV